MKKSLLLLMALFIMGGVISVKAQSKYLKLGSVLTLEQAVTASTNGTGFAIVYNDTKLFATSTGENFSMVDLSTAARGYIFKLAFRTTVDDVQYYRVTCFNPNNTLVAAGDACGIYGGNILSPVSWGSIWSSTVLSKDAEHSGDGNAYTAEEWDGRDSRYSAQWCFVSDGSDGYYIKSRGGSNNGNWVSNSGGMTNENGRASFKFYSLVAKDKATLNFNANGVATLDLSNYEVTEGLTYDPETGILTSTTTSGDFYFLFDDEDFSNVTRIDVERTVSGTEGVIPFSDIIDNLNIYRATTNESLHTWYSSKYGVSDFQSYTPGRVNKIQWHINKTGTMKLTGVIVTGNVVNGAAPGWIDLTKAMYNTSCELNLNKDEGTVVYGRMWDFTTDDYADITNYPQMKLTGTAGTVVRVFINSTSAQYYTLNSEGVLTIDFATDPNYKDASYIHLCNIRPNGTANISSIQLYNPNYVINGSGRINPSAQAILDNESMTYIDATGVTGSGVTLTPANPNCIFKANSGVLANANNVMVGTTIANLSLTDNYPFAVPEGATATTATYTRSMTSQYGTICLPYNVPTPANAKFYTLGAMSGETVTLVDVGEELAAGTPAIVEKTSGTSISAAGSGALAVAGNATQGSLKAYGSYVSKTVTTSDYSGYDIYALATVGDEQALWQTSNAINVKPFRAYFVSTTLSSPAKLRFVMEEEGATAIEALAGEGKASVVGIFSVNGTRQNSLQKGINVVKLSDGRTQKIMVK